MIACSSRWLSMCLCFRHVLAYLSAFMLVEIFQRFSKPGTRYENIKEYEHFY